MYRGVLRCTEVYRDVLRPYDNARSLRYPRPRHHEFASPTVPAAPWAPSPRCGSRAGPLSISAGCGPSLEIPPRPVGNVARAPAPVPASVARGGCALEQSVGNLCQLYAGPQPPFRSPATTVRVPKRAYLPLATLGPRGGGSPIVPCWFSPGICRTRHSHNAP